MLNRRPKHRQMFNVSVLFTISRTAAWHQTSSTIHQPVANWPISVLTTLILLTQRKMTSIEYFHSRGQHICKFIGTKESVCIRKEFHSQRTDLGNMATVSLFWDTNMAAVTSCENTLYVNKWNRNWELPADESDSRIRSIALVSDWNKFIFSVSPKKERFEIIIHY